MAPTPAPKSRSDYARPHLRRILQLLAGNPCPCSHSTTPSWPQTNLPSNSRSPPRSRMARLWAQRGVRLWHTHRPDSDNPSHALYSTTLFWQQTNPPANWRNRPGNCRDLLGVVVLSADHRCDDGRSTMSACLGPNRSTLPPRNCTDRQVRPALGVLWAVAWAEESRVELPAAWVAEWAVVWVAAWEMEWVAPSVWSPAELLWRNHGPLWHSSNPSVPETMATL